MYCVIQEIQNRKTPYRPTSKRIEANASTWSVNGVTKTSYGYSYSEEKFERSIRKAYKISIHKSYRENGKVKKKQWSICTMDYYSLLESWPGDHLTSKKLKSKLEAIGIDEDTLWEMVYAKLNPIIEKVTEEFQQTEEYKAQKEQRKILDKYQKAKETFEKKYGEDTYRFCYDVFEVLRNKEYLEKLKVDYEAQEQYKRSYQESYHSNYNWNNFRSYQGANQSNYSTEEKEVAEKIIQAGFRQLSKQYHPDVGGTKELFQLLGNLKDKLLNHVK